MINIDRLLETATRLGAEGFYLRSGSPPIFRHKGQRRTLDTGDLTGETLGRVAKSLLSRAQREALESGTDVSLTLGYDNRSRFLVHLSPHDNGIAIDFHRMDTETNAG